MPRSLFTFALLAAASGSVLGHPGHEERGWIAAFLYHVLADHLPAAIAALLCAAGMLLLVRRWRKGNAK